MSSRILSPIIIAAGLAAITVALVACASAPKQSRTEAASPAPDAAGAGQDYNLARKAEIREAWDKIAQLRQDPKLGLSREPANPLSTAASLTDLRQCVEGPEEPEVTAGCSDVCNIKDAICDNAEDICRIAEDLGGDVWADDKCNSAKASCKEAKEICCGCIDASSE